MGRRRKKPSKPYRPLLNDLSPQARQGVGAVFFAVLGIFFSLSALGYAGMAGDVTYMALDYLFGVGFVLAPIACVFYMVTLLRPQESGETSMVKMLGITISFLAALGLLSLYNTSAGGISGAFMVTPLEYLLEPIATGVLLGALFIVGILLSFNTGIALPQFWKKKEEDADMNKEALDYDPVPELAELNSTQEETESEQPNVVPAKSFREKIGLGGGQLSIANFSGPYDPPPLSLLERDKGKARTGDVKANANIIKRTLLNFNIEVEMDEVSIGPSVTRYSLKPAEGVRISKIVGLQNNLELALAAHPIRIEAPIPGKSLVGIEVPNTAKTTVGLASLLSTPEYTDSPKHLLTALGRDIAGNAHFSNLGKMPHLLIAGTTGSGKSVTIHALVTSLLFRNSPEQLRFLMVDPKRVELTLYNGIPHLLAPVITDAKKTILSLKWAAKEMDRRYDILEAEKVRDVDSYHQNVYQPARKKWEAGKGEEGEESLPEPLPYIVIIIDELADIMSAYPRELEAAIVRLAQMSRAVGIHLVLSTQRPSVNVITGLIKANIPARLALQVASQIDSRTILDQVGAEKLLGAGDLLFLSGELSKPIRLQSAFISETEVKRVTDYLKGQAAAHRLDSIDLSEENERGGDEFFSSMEDGEADDDLYEDAKQTVVSMQKASTSYLQRRLGIGYSRAARLIDMLEEHGVIGPGNGSKPREVLIGRGEQAEESANEE